MILDESLFELLKKDTNESKHIKEDYIHDEYDDFEEEEIISEPEETTHPKNAVKYYIRVNNTDSGVAEVYGVIKEFEDGVKIGIHKEESGEKVATDLRTGFKVIGTHSPIYKGGELVEPKKKNSELFDQAHELIKSINQEYYNNIPDVKSFVAEQDVVEEDLTDKALQNLEDRDKDFELDKEAERQAKVELAKQGIDKDTLKEDLSQEQAQEYGLNTLINQLIKSEYDAIDEYNSAIVTLETEGQGEYTDVIRSIIEDERHHIGNLQEIMNRITPGTTAEFEHGKEEAIETLDEEKPEEETKTTIDTENGEIKTYKLSDVKTIKDTELEDSALQG